MLVRGVVPTVPKRTSVVTIGFLTALYGLLQIVGLYTRRTKIVVGGFSNFTTLAGARIVVALDHRKVCILCSCSVVAQCFARQCTKLEAVSCVVIPVI